MSEVVAGNMEDMGGMAASRAVRAIKGWAEFLPSLPQGTAIAKLLHDYKRLGELHLRGMAWILVRMH